MTLFWIILTAVSLLMGLWMAYPFFRGRSVEMSGADEAISIYRDQLDEVERDHAAGLINDGECEAARMEIERRALVAARHMDQGQSVSGRSILAAGGLTALAAAGVLIVYGGLGRPDVPDQPLAARKTERLIQMAEAGDINSRIQLLIEKTKEQPDSFEDWWVLANSYASIGDHASSADAYRHAAMLSDDRPAVLSAYAEAMTLANGNKVPGAARVIFEQLASEENDPRARYYLALAKAQSQDFEGALMDWTVLARDSSPNAPWVPLVRRDIVNMARFLKQDVTQFLPDATVTEISAAGGTSLLPDATATPDTNALEQALAKDPKDYKGWIALAEARAGVGDSDGAAEALAAAQEHFAGAPFVLQKVAEAERALGLDLVTPERRSPTDADIAAAGDMTQEERDDMIEGMVAGLAARLDEEPNDPDGWVMLVRSYATLGRDDKARDAYGRAVEVFAGNDRVLKALEAQTSGITALQ